MAEYVPGGNLTVPVCRYYDTAEKEWKTDGCQTVSFNATHMKCACTHLSTFSASEDTAIPAIGFDDVRKLRSITYDKIRDNPGALYISLAALCASLLFAISVPKKNDRPLISVENLWNLLSPI